MEYEVDFSILASVLVTADTDEEAERQAKLIALTEPSRLIIVDADTRDIRESD